MLSCAGQLCVSWVMPLLSAMLTIVLVRVLPVGVACVQFPLRCVQLHVSRARWYRDFDQLRPNMVDSRAISTILESLWPILELGHFEGYIGQRADLDSPFLDSVIPGPDYDLTLPAIRLRAHAHAGKEHWRATESR